MPDLKNLTERVELLEKIVVEQGKTLDMLVRLNNTMGESIELINQVIQSDEPRIPDHENIRGKDYYK